MSKIAKDAFAQRNYRLAAELFERLIHEKTHPLNHIDEEEPLSGHDDEIHHYRHRLHPSTVELYFWYGDSLARNGQLHEAFDVYAHIAEKSREIIPVERFKHLCIGLIDSICGRPTQICSLQRAASLTMRSNQSSTIVTNNNNSCSSTANSSSSCLTQTSGFSEVSTLTVSMRGSAAQRHSSIAYQRQRSLASNNISGATTRFLIPTLQQTPAEMHDPLLCAICEEVLRCPVTVTCGHTFCRECCTNPADGQQQILSCPLCGLKLPNVFNGIPVTTASSTIPTNINNNSSAASGQFSFNQFGQSGIKPDILVLKLVDKWWSHEIHARELNDDAVRYLDNNSLDDALKYCNESLVKSANNQRGLLLRSEVLYRLSHYQSSLADADNALKTRPTSAKAYQRRALALCGLGRNEEALIAFCLAVCFDRNLTTNQYSSVSLKNEMCRLLQRFFVPSYRSNFSSSVLSETTPYSVLMTRRRRRRRMMHFAQAVGASDCDEVNSSCGEDDHNFVHENHHHSQHGRHHPYHSYSRRMTVANIDSYNIFMPRPNQRLRTLIDRIHQEVQKHKRIESDPYTVQVNPAQVDISDFDCVLCCRTLWRPVVTPCGHTYCWVCLDRCMDYSSACPLCMSPLVEQYHRTNHRGSSTPVPFSLQKKSVTRFLEVAMQRFIPEWYEKRRRQEVELEPSVPVFICTTAFPQVPCPLFVYEPRYRLMVRRAIESGERQFGIVQPHIGKSRYSDVGTMLDIRDCVLLGDGCSILSTIGCRRFRILQRDEKDGYETAKVEYIYDEPIPDNYAHIVSDMHAGVIKKAIRWYESLSEPIKEEVLRSLGPMPGLEDNWETIADGPAWAWWIIAILPLNQQLKVNILATTSLEKRLRAIGKTLDYISGKLRRTHQSCVVVQCEGLPDCQALDCCQRTAVVTTSATSTHSPETGHDDVVGQTDYFS